MRLITSKPLRLRLLYLFISEYCSEPISIDSSQTARIGANLRSTAIVLAAANKEIERRYHFC